MTAGARFGVSRIITPAGAVSVANPRPMARRNRKSRKANADKRAARDVKPTAEEMKQERTFFIVTGIVTLLIVIGLFVFLTN